MKLIPTDLNEDSIKTIFFPPIDQIALPPPPLLSFVQKYLKKKESVLVALSGGPDSVALLLMLKKLSVAVGAFYLNHHIREEKEASGEELFVHILCDFYQVPLHHESLPVGFLVTQAKQNACSLESLARQFRYDRFKKEFQKTGYDWLATAHHLDDLMETQVMRFFSGASARGLVGIRLRANRLIRPLLGCRKKELLSWLEKSKLPYLIDSTNEAPLYLRNRIRLELMPQLEKLFPGLSTSLCATALKMELQTECNDFYLNKSHLYSSCCDGFFTLDWEKLRSLPMALQVEAIIQWFSESRIIDNEDLVVPWKMVFQSLNRSETAYGVNRELFSFEKVKVLLAFHKGKKVLILKKGSQNRLESDVKNQKDQEEVCSYLPIEQNFFIQKDEWETFTEGKLIALMEWPDGNIKIIFTEQFPKGAGVALPLDFLADKKVITIRSWIFGDQISTEKGSSRLKKIFNNWKLSYEAKKKIPLIVVDGQVVALLGSAQGQKEVIAKSCFRRKENQTDKWIRILFEKCCLLPE